MQAVTFDTPGLLGILETAPDDALDGCDFGIIGFDQEGIVRRYNRFESQAAGLQLAQVVGHPLFTVVAPCMNNFMVAQRFEDAQAGETPLDEAIDYVLTLRMRPSRVKLRLLSQPGSALRYVAVRRTI